MNAQCVLYSNIELDEMSSCALIPVAVADLGWIHAYNAGKMVEVILVHQLLKPKDRE